MTKKGRKNEKKNDMICNTMTKTEGPFDFLFRDAHTCQFLIECPHPPPFPGTRAREAGKYSKFKNFGKNSISSDKFGD